MRRTIEARRDDVMHYRGGECKVRNIGGQGFFGLGVQGPRLDALGQIDHVWRESDPMLVGALLSIKMPRQRLLWAAELRLLRAG
jgi:hypothetical protein